MGCERSLKAFERGESDAIGTRCVGADVSGRCRRRGGRARPRCVGVVGPNLGYQMILFVGDVDVAGPVNSNPLRVVEAGCGAVGVDCTDTAGAGKGHPHQQRPLTRAERYRYFFHTPRRPWLGVLALCSRPSLIV
jgi:hypothetical protein